MLMFESTFCKMKHFLKGKYMIQYIPHLKSWIWDSIYFVENCLPPDRRKCPVRLGILFKTWNGEIKQVILIRGHLFYYPKIRNAVENWDGIFDWGIWFSSKSDLQLLIKIVTFGQNCSFGRGEKWGRIGDGESGSLLSLDSFTSDLQILVKDCDFRSEL